MKTAIIFAGQMRTFDACFPRMKKQLASYFWDADFFVSTVADAAAAKTDLIQAEFPAASVEIATVPEQPDCIAELRAAGCVLPDEWTSGTRYMKELFPITVHPQAIARQLWQLNQAWKLVAASPSFHDYGRFVRIRPDLMFNAAVVNVWPEAREAHTPFWGRFAGINDRFAVLGRQAAEAYFTTYANLAAAIKAGADLHAETLIKRALLGSGCVIRDDLPAIFSTLRETGERRPPEILVEDVRFIASR